MSKHNDESNREILDELRHLKHEIHELKDSYMIAQATLDASLLGLTNAVTAAVAALATANTGTSTPDAVVAAYQSGVDAQAIALASATPPPVTAATAAK